MISDEDKEYCQYLDVLEIVEWVRTFGLIQNDLKGYIYASYGAAKIRVFYGENMDSFAGVIRIGGSFKQARACYDIEDFLKVVNHINKGDQMLTPDQYLKVLNLGFPLSPPPQIGGLSGRIIRGKNPEDFEKLSDDPSRKIVFLTDSLGLAKMLGKSGYEMLVTVGHHPDHIESQVNLGKTYKMVVFPASQSQPATWDGLFKVTADVYPDLVADIGKHHDVLVKIRFADIEATAGYKFHDVDDPDNDRYMSYDKYLNSGRSAWELRAFMYHVLHIRELFRGDGYTYDENGKRGVKEFLIANKPIADIAGSAVGDIDVQLP